MGDESRIRVDAAMDMPTGVQREIRVAAANCLVVLATEHYFKPGAHDRDMDVARTHHHRVIVLLKRGLKPPDGHFPEWAEIHEVTYDDGMREACALLDRLLR